MQPELIVGCRCVVGESPLWHPTEQRLYWIDVPAGHLHRYDPASEEHQRVLDDDVIGGLTIQADGSLLLFGSGGSIRTWDDGRVETVVEGIPDERDSRFNDVIADPEGRVFCGTMPTEDRPGRLYRLDRDGELTTLLERVDVPNGFGFSPAYDRLYFTETGTGFIHMFDYDRESGLIASRSTFVDAMDDEAKPDGLTVDADGHVWSARWDNGSVVRYAPNGTLVERYDLPVEKVTSVAFGGTDATDLYVTTAHADETDANEAAGGVFRLPIDADGRHECLSRISN